MLSKSSLVLLTLFIAGCGSSSDEQSAPLTPVTPPDTLLPTEIQDPLYPEQWYLNLDTNFYSSNNIDLDAHIHAANYLMELTGIGIKIAVIDDGLDVTHEDLKTAVTRTYDLATGGADVSHTEFDDFHGTAVTGILGARSNNLGIKGVASNAELFFLKYKSAMTDSETISLFNKANEWGADIINNSWGTGNVSQAVKDTIINLSKNGRNGKGMNIVFAAGNDNELMGNDESSIPEVISVGATNKDNLRASYSDFGAELDVMAPGGFFLGISTLDPMGSAGVASLDVNYLLYNDANGFAGTSATAAIVSGVIALLLEINPNLSSTEMSDLLHNTADKIGILDYDLDGRNDYYGYGKVNVSKAIEALQ